MRIGLFILALFSGQAVYAEDLWIPLVQPEDVSVSQILDNGAMLVQSGTSSFVCPAIEENEAFVFEDCKPILSRFSYIQLQLESQARVETARLEALSLSDIDEATIATLKSAGCSIEIGAFDFFSNEALVAFSSNVGIESDLAPFLRDTVETLTRDSLKRVFATGAVIFLNNQTKISLKDCA